jgi:hypothetical protein
VSLSIPALAIAVVTFAYIAIRWRKSPKAFKAMSSVAVASAISGILAGVWVTNFVGQQFKTAAPSGSPARPSIVPEAPSGSRATTSIVPEANLTPEQARAKLASMGIPYRQDIFVQEAQSGDGRVVGLFLRAGMNENQDACAEALSEAALAHRADIVEALLAAGTKLKNSDDLLVSVAEGKGNAPVLRALLAAGANPNANRMGRTALVAAIDFADDPEMVKALIDAGADAKKGNLLTGCRDPLLGWVAEGCKNPEVQRILQQAGAN